MMIQGQTNSDLRTEGSYGFFWGSLAVYLAYCNCLCIALLVAVPLLSRKSTQLGILWGFLCVAALYAIPLCLKNQRIFAQGSQCQLGASPLLHYITVTDLHCPDGAICIIEKARWKRSQGVILSLPKIEVVKSHVVATAPLAQHYQPLLSSLSRDLFDAFCFGRSGSYNTWSALIGSYGLRHLLCFSGWHAHKLWEFSGRRRIVFTLIGGIYLIILKLPFSFLCAYIKVLLKAFATTEKAQKLWPLALILGSVTCPFCWTQMSYWLTIYYIVLIEITGFCENKMRLSGLGWSAVLGMEIEMFAWILGTFVERYFLQLIIFVMMSYGLHFISPAFVNILTQWLFYAFDCARIFKLTFKIQPTLGALLLLSPFFMTPKSHMRHPITNQQSIPGVALAQDLLS